jgi:hypothetical protein
MLADTSVEGTERTVTLGDGQRIRERLVTSDDEVHRLVWSVVDGPFTHYNAVAAVLPESDTTSRLIWTTDFLPDDATQLIAGLMEGGIELMRTTIEAVSTS